MQSRVMECHRRSTVLRFCAAFSLKGKSVNLPDCYGFIFVDHRQSVFATVVTEKMRRQQANLTIGKPQISGLTGISFGIVRKY
jgi:hypothetical protein